MSYLRVTIDLAIKEPLPQALVDRLPQIKLAIRTLKSYAEKINAGQHNEEDTTKTTFHTCHHDTGDQLCEPEQEI